jgi:hypothetical protein
MFKRPPVSWPARPAIRNCGEVLGHADLRSGEEQGLYRHGFLQRIATHHATQQFDYIIKNNLLWHTMRRGIAMMSGVHRGLNCRTGLGYRPERHRGQDRRAAEYHSGNIPYTQLACNGSGSVSRRSTLAVCQRPTWIKATLDQDWRRFGCTGLTSTDGQPAPADRLTSAARHRRFRCGGQRHRLYGRPVCLCSGQFDSNHTIPSYTSWDGTTPPCTS